MLTTAGVAASDIVLRDGSTLHVRVIAPGDADGVHALYARLSQDSLRNRFGCVHHPGAAEITALCGHDGRDALALIAERGPRIVGLVEYYPLPARPGHAEVAFTVDDAFQGLGVGTRMLDMLAAIARERGMAAFDASMLGTNHQMVHVFNDSGFALKTDIESGTIHVRLSIADSVGHQDRAASRARTAASASMRAFFEPRTVAVVGVNRERKCIGSEIFHNLVDGGFGGHVFAVNPALRSTVERPAYASVLDIPGDVDLAVVAVPAAHVEAVVDDCITKQVGAIVVISAGFGETDEAGRAREARLVSKVRSAGIRMIGPNCMGILNTDPAVRLNATFAPGKPPAGRVALSSQSGALGLAILDYARHLNLGLSTFVSVGNKADVSGNDLIQYWSEDPRTDVILLYLESFGNPGKFSELARRIGRRKPIVAVKAGRSAAGARAAASHTGALAAGDAAVDTLFRQSGVVRTETLEEMFDVATLLAHQPVPQGARVGIVTNAGGPAILATDACDAHGLVVPELRPETRNALRAFLPDAASVGNPVDMLATASADDYRRAIPILLADPGIDSLLVIFIPPLVTEAADVAAAIVTSARAAQKTVLATFMSAQGTPAELAPIPCYAFPESAARALAHATDYGIWRQTPQGSVPVFADMRLDVAREIVRAARDRGETWLDADACQRLLDASGIAVVRAFRADSEEDAVSLAAARGGPVALKAAGPGIVHKTERHGVILNLADPDAVRAAYRDLAGRFGATLTHVLVQPMVAGGVEMLVGAAVDPSLGPLVVCGMGGTLTELVRDSSSRLPPLTDVDAGAMIDELRGATLLRGFRGRTPADEAALRDVLLRVSALVDACPEILEMDINPLMVFEHGARAVDVRIRVGDPPTRPANRRVAY